MADLSAVKSNIITGFRQDAAAILAAVSGGMQRRQFAIDIGLAAGPNAFVDADFVGENNHIAAAALLDAVAVISDLNTHLAATVATVPRDRAIKLAKLLRAP